VDIYCCPVCPVDPSGTKISFQPWATSASIPYSTGCLLKPGAQTSGGRGARTICWSRPSTFSKCLEDDEPWREGPKTTHALHQASSFFALFHSVGPGFCCPVLCFANLHFCLFVPRGPALFHFLEGRTRLYLLLLWCMPPRCREWNSDRCPSLLWMLQRYGSLRPIVC